MRITAIIVSTLTAGLFLSACGQSDQAVLSEQGLSIELENGGFELGQPAPELAVFEQEFERAQTREYPQDDDAEAEAHAPPDRPVFIVRLAWGQFPLDRELTEWTHWRGLVYGLGARVFVQRAIFYERHDFFRPCRGFDCVQIDSRTLPHHDGLVLKVVPTAPGAALLIGFEGKYGRIIPLDRLAGLSDVARVDELGNQVVLDAFARPACPAGMLGGVWKRLDPRGGVFGGDWLNEEGLAAGKLSGIWGQREDGQKVFFGIYSDTEGRFLGLLRGGYAEFPFVGGAFAGHWIQASGDLGGVLAGRFGPHPGPEPVAVFHGRFQAVCEQGPPPGEPLPGGPYGPDCAETGACELTGSILRSCACEETPPDQPADCRCRP